MTRNLTTRAAAVVLFLATVVCAPAALADGPWSVAAHVGNAAVDRLVEDSGDWWSRVDDSGAALGLSVAYDYSPVMGVRLMYERAAELAAGNRCPPGDVCPAIAIDEEVDFTAWQIAAVPRLPLGPDWSLFGTLGAMRWELHRDNLLPGDSGTELVYGLGLAWRGQRIELGAEYQRAGIDLDSFRVSAGVRF